MDPESDGSLPASAPLDLEKSENHASTNVEQLKILMPNKVDKPASQSLKPQNVVFPATFDEFKRMMGTDPHWAIYNTGMLEIIALWTNN